jgi:hypothetical protein
LYRIGVVLLAGDFLVEKFCLTLLVLPSFLLFGNCLAELGFSLLKRGVIRIVTSSAFSGPPASS